MNVLQVQYQDRLYQIGDNPPDLDGEEARRMLVQTIEATSRAYLANNLEGWEPFRFEIIDDETGLASDDPGSLVFDGESLERSIDAAVDRELGSELDGVGIGWLIAPTIIALAGALIGLAIGLVIG